MVDSHSWTLKMFAIPRIELQMYSQNRIRILDPDQLSTCNSHCNFFREKKKNKNSFIMAGREKKVLLTDQPIKSVCVKTSLKTYIRKAVSYRLRSGNPTTETDHTKKNLRGVKCYSKKMDFSVKHCCLECCFSERWPWQRQPGVQWPWKQMCLNERGTDMREGAMISRAFCQLPNVVHDPQLSSGREKKKKKVLAWSQTSQTRFSSPPDKRCCHGFCRKVVSLICIAVVLKACLGPLLPGTWV